MIFGKPLSESHLMAAFNNPANGRSFEVGGSNKQRKSLNRWIRTSDSEGLSEVSSGNFPHGGGLSEKHLRGSRQTISKKNLGEESGKAIVQV